MPLAILKLILKSGEFFRWHMCFGAAERSLSFSSNGFVHPLYVTPRLGGIRSHEQLREVVLDPRRIGLRQVNCRIRVQKIELSKTLVKIGRLNLSLATYQVRLRSLNT